MRIADVEAIRRVRSGRGCTRITAVAACPVAGGVSVDAGQKKEDVMVIAQTAGADFKLARG